MERNFAEPSQDEATQALAPLTKDRDRLVRGIRIPWALTGILGTLLALLSVSLGLVASDMRWAVMITSLVASGVTTGLAGFAYRCAVENIRRDGSPF